MFDFTYVRLLRRLGNWLLYAFRFLESCAFSSVISLLKPISGLSDSEKSCEGMELRGLNPQYSVFLKKKDRNQLLTHFSYLKVVLSALLSCCRSRFPVYLLSKNFLLDWSCIGINRCGSLFFGEKRKVGIGCLRIIGFLKVALCSAVISQPKPISGQTFI